MFNGTEVWKDWGTRRREIYIRMRDVAGKKEVFGGKGNDVVVEPSKGKNAFNLGAILQNAWPYNQTSWIFVQTN